jgi:predicted DNA-binding transcriptional regulator
LVQAYLEFLANGEKSLKITDTKCCGVVIYMLCVSSWGGYLSEIVKKLMSRDRSVSETVKSLINRDMPVSETVKSLINRDIPVSETVKTLINRDISVYGTLKKQ